jgi:hypothetical protein
LSISSVAERLKGESSQFLLEKTMKFVCLGYFDDKKWETMSETEQKAFMEECFAYDDVLRKGGHVAGGNALDSPRKAATLRFKEGKVTVTDGPYAETKEQVGGILILEAEDRAHAIELISKHPGLRIGPFEIRAQDEAITAAFEARNQGGRGQ